jgi:hypothetical protein
MRLSELDNIFLKAKGKRQKAKGFGKLAVGVEFDRRGVWVDWRYGWRDSSVEGEASTATFTVAVEFRDQAG